MSLEAYPLKLTDVSKSFSDNRVIRNLNLAVSEGDLYALLGVNGVGKTTTLRMIAGLLKPDTGDIRVAGYDIWRSPEHAKRLLAYLPDDPFLYDLLKPLEYLEFVAGLWGYSGNETASRANHLLEWLDLAPYINKDIKSFSRGMRQKLALVGALVHEPSIIILDEPFTGLDSHSARKVKNLFGRLVDDGKTVIFTTHTLEVAEQLANRIGIVSGGAIVADGGLQEIQQHVGRSGTLEELFFCITNAHKAEED